jgi:hypothetical protein
VIEHGKKGGNKDDRRQHLEGEEKSHWLFSRTKLTENELRSLEGIAKQAIDGVSRLLEKPASELNLQDEDGEHNLQAQAPGNGFLADGAAVGREGVGEAQHREQTEDASKTSHLVFPFVNHTMNQGCFVHRRNGRNLAETISLKIKDNQTSKIKDQQSKIEGGPL